jgi:putative intracellular protease/amidase
MGAPSATLRSGDFLEQQTVYLFVFDGLADWEAGHAIAGLNNPAFQVRPGRYRVQTAAVEARPVVTAGGVTILPDGLLEAIEPPGTAMLVLPGGEAWDRGGNAEAAPKARALFRAGIPVAAICGATAGLARAGLLDDKRHTSNSADYLAATGYRGGHLYQDELAVTDGALITASGTAPVDFAFQIFERLEVYTTDAAVAWRGLFKTGDPAYYAALLKAIGA